MYWGNCACVVSASLCYKKNLNTSSVSFSYLTFISLFFLLSQYVILINLHTLSLHVVILGVTQRDGCSY